jgi:hypothetical protein
MEMVVRACGQPVGSPAVCLVITGPPGSGKRRHLRELLTHQRDWNDNGASLLGTPPEKSGDISHLPLAPSSSRLGPPSLPRLIFISSSCCPPEPSVEENSVVPPICVLLLDVKRFAVLGASLPWRQQNHAAFAKLFRSSKCIVTTAASLCDVPETFLKEIGTCPVEIPCHRLCQSVTMSGQAPAIRRVSMLLETFIGDDTVPEGSARARLVRGLLMTSIGGVPEGCSISDAVKYVCMNDLAGASARLSPLYGLEGPLAEVQTLIRIHQARHSVSQDAIPVDGSADTSRRRRLVAHSAPTTTGILLHGPSGCGKTALLQQLPALLPGVPFYFVSPQRLFSKYFGESEARLRDLFAAARRQPCVVVIDDVEVLAPRREAHDSSTGAGGGLGVGRRMLAALLCEMDGVADSRGVLVVAATRGVKELDGALLRQGRLETIISVPLPSEGSLRLFASELASRFDFSEEGKKVIRPLSHETQSEDFVKKSPASAKERLVEAALAACSNRPASFVERYFGLVVETLLRNGERPRLAGGLEPPSDDALASVAAQMLS